jgi:pimeloyl-ACP methyl ester carboxylesterase
MPRRTFFFRVKLFLGFLVALIAGLFYFLEPYGEQRAHFTPPAKECFEGNKGQTWRACIFRAAGGTNGELAYYLHGSGGNVDTWNSDTYSTGQVQQYWEENHILPPIVVTISFPGFWLLSPKGEASDTGLLETFLDEVMPEIDRRVGPTKAKIISGESMGGLNSLIAGLRAPERFRRIVAQCPPIYEVSPFANWRDIRSFFRQTGADPKTILGVFGLARHFAANDAEWDRISPLKLLSEIDPQKVPEIYLTAGLYDRYGIYAGVEKFAELAKERHLKIEWRPLYGNHCVMDVASFAEALTEGHPGEKLRSL